MVGDTFFSVWNLERRFRFAPTIVSAAWRSTALRGTRCSTRGFGGGTGTAGSSLGHNFAGFDPYGGNITATYFNAVSLNGAAPVGDLYANFLLAVR